MLFLKAFRSRSIAWLALAACLLPLVGGCTTVHHADGRPFALQPGDLLFQDTDGGPLCDAIEQVTQGVEGAHLTHVGVVERVDNGQAVVIEAISPGVVETPLADFLARSTDAEGHPKVLVGRLRAPYRHLIPPAIADLRTRLGKPYDKDFLITNDAYYCSELVYEGFKAANGGAPLFQLHPMTFRSPGTGETFPVWAQYFADLGEPVPEGEPGLNPGGMSRSRAITIVYHYGRPDGWQGR